MEVACRVRDGFHVRGLYSDLRYHDVGPEFYQVQYDGTVVKQFRTPPLWGVGNSAPYGHDGASLDLESVILRHGGDARQSRQQFTGLSDDEQQALVAFLRSLVLYQTDQLACDINGDGRIDESFTVAGQNIGRESLRRNGCSTFPAGFRGRRKTYGKRESPQWPLPTCAKLTGWISRIFGTRTKTVGRTSRTRSRASWECAECQWDGKCASRSSCRGHS